jgi:hypothetical protein
MRKPTQRIHIEPRWPVGLAIFAVLLLLGLLPDRVRAFPNWVLAFVGITMIAPMVALSLATTQERWLHIEKIATVLFFVIAGLGAAQNLTELLTKMVYRSAEITGVRLLTSSIAVWASNVLVFSLAYWRIDRGGPEARANHRNGKPEWLFPRGDTGGGARRVGTPFCGLLISGILYGDRLQPYRHSATDGSRQIADDAGKHDLTRDDRRCRRPCNQHTRQLNCLVSCNT